MKNDQKKCKHGKKKNVCVICRLEDDKKKLNKVCFDLNAITVRQRDQVKDKKEEIEKLNERLEFLISRIKALAKAIVTERNQSNIKIKNNYKKSYTKRDIYIEFGIVYKK